MDHLVSIVMPAYNAEKFIVESIESVIAQTYNSWELLVVDNNSTDSTSDIVKSYTQKDKRVKYLQEKSPGAANARNHAIKQAKGRFIAFLDSDDLWVKDKLDKQLVLMLENNLYLSYCNYHSFGDKDEYVIRPEKVGYKQLLKYCVINCSTAMYDAERLGKKYYFPVIKTSEDWSLWCIILRDSNSPAMGFQEFVIEHRVNETSLSSNKLECAYYHYVAFRKILKINLLATWYYFSIYMLHHGTVLIKRKFAGNV